MAKYLKLDTSGDLKEETGTTVSAGAGDAGKLIQLDNTGKVDQSVLPVGVGTDTQVLTASEALGAGDLINIWTDTGAVKIRKADASAAGKEADGFVLAAVASGASGTVYFEDDNTQLTGLTPGATYFLSPTTPGGVTTTVPTGAGQVVQKVGKAISATALKFERGTPIVRA